jgi:hypothetical protein
MISKKRLYIAIAATAVAICIIGSAVFAASQNFRPDVIFKGSSLTGWHKVGQADWRADNGEIIAPPKESGGWLMLDKGYQDIAFYASFLCVGACQTGLLLRAEKIAGGMKGIYVSLAGGHRWVRSAFGPAGEGNQPYPAGTRSGDGAHGRRPLQRRGGPGTRLREAGAHTG